MLVSSLAALGDCSSERIVSYLMLARAQTDETSTTTGLIKRSHAPELTLNLTGFPFVIGTCSPFKGGTIGNEQRSEAAGRRPLGGKAAHHARYAAARASTHLGVQQEKPASSMTREGLEKPVEKGH